MELSFYSAIRMGGLRPIAVGEVLHRLTSKCAGRDVLSESINILYPSKLGVGLSSGCKAIIHAVSDTLEDNSIHLDQKHILLVDFSNAFNSVSSDLLFREVLSHIPSLYSWMECSYGSQPFLLLGDESIQSCCGVQQGNPLGLLGFSLVLHPMVQKIREQVPGLIMVSR